MTAILLLTLVVGGTALLSRPLGRYMRWAMDPTGGGPQRRRIDRLFERVAGSPGRQQQHWRQYMIAMLVFNAIMFAVAFGFMALQQYLPLNPDDKGAVEPSLIFHTIASFTSNTNLQHYSGEVTLSYLSQLFSLMWLQFVSAATGIAALAALARGVAGRKEMGNFFIDLQRATFLVLLPLGLVVATLMALGRMPMTLAGAATASTLEGAPQVIARGPVAAFLTIKQLGTNGGGFFGPNCTHPFENPTFWTNGLAMISIILIPMGSVWMFGRMVGRMRHAAVVFGVMLALLLAKIAGAVWFETAPTEAFADLPAVEQVAGNFEGKEMRFGVPYGSGPMWGVLTTSTSNGSVGAMQDSLNPLAGLMPMIGMWLNATFGGVGVGMINMFIYIIVAVFIAGMMVGRTPEYLNRRVEAREMKLAILTVFAHGFFILVGAAVFAATPWGQDTLNNWGPHGFSEILYEFSSAGANNGSGFEGLGDNTVPWNIATGLVMLLNRYIPIILPLAIAGSLAAKRPTAQSAGTLSVEDSTFAVMLLATIVLIGALTFFPAAALGPIAEHLLFM
jgi:K+-transporting ATPase ATPase A chain